MKQKNLEIFRKETSDVIEQIRILYRKGSAIGEGRMEYWNIRIKNVTINYSRHLNG